ncbi:MAG: PKD domain-containing protein [Flavobacteriales bacterium]|nr:PKD domain-containing protein [Flavobacteriales bacterium]
MKKLLFMGAMLGVMSLGFSQQGNNWHFGDGASLHFPSGGGSPTVGSGSLITNEGCATISDATGSLLFYTDGVNIWNASNTLINGSTPLLGHSSSSQSAVIVPKPGNINRYFIFTQGEKFSCYSQSSCHGLNYSEVDVSSGVSLISANNPLLSASVTTEKVTAACNSNGTDYWVSTVKQNGDFVTYPISSTGVGSAIISSGAGISATATNTSSGHWLNDRVGYMKFSPDGNRLALARRQSNSINEIFSFDPSTGMVTSNDGTYHIGTVYGLEFSSDNNYLYTSEGFSSVSQYDLNTTGYPKSILHTTSSGGSSSVGALQLGPDGNIYVANGYEGTNGYFLDVIQNINSNSPIYLNNHVTLQSGTHSRLGLPDFVSCFFQPELPCDADVSFTYRIDEGCNVSFSPIVTPANGTTIISYQWNFGDGTSSNEQFPFHRFDRGSRDEVCLTVTAFDGTECCTITYCERIPELDCEPTECKAEYKILYNQDDCSFDFSAFLISINREFLGGYWDFGDGNTATGLNPSHSYTASGLYTVTFTAILKGNDGECCVSTFSREVTCGQVRRVKSSSEQVTNQLKETSSIKIAPNPSKGMFNIDFKDDTFDHLIIRNIQGKVIKRINISNETNKLTLNLSNKDNGIYFVTMIGNSNQQTVKISKQ